MLAVRQLTWGGVTYFNSKGVNSSEVQLQR